MADAQNGDATRLDVATVVRSVRSRMQKRMQDTVSDATIEDVVKVLDPELAAPAGKTPQLRIDRLRFVGTKTLLGVATPSPFTYDQTFQTGVNVLVIEDNDVGKSTILKTMRFALTGDDGQYDPDVRTWIRSVWPTFTVGAAAYTVVIRRNDGHVDGALLFGTDQPDFDAAVSSGRTVFVARSAERLRAKLQAFFFEKLGLVELGWVQQTDGDGGYSESRTTWATYSQPLIIPDTGYDYLLCDPDHAYGNQEGLIFSAYLGLHFAEALNRLSIELSKAKRTGKLSEDQVADAQKTIDELKKDLTKQQTALKTLDDALVNRQKVLEGPDISARLASLRREIDELSAQRRKADEARDGRNKELVRLRGRLARVQEAISLRLSLSGLEVSMCPNCENDIDSALVKRESETHTCRLCGKLARTADQDAIGMLTSELEALNGNIARLVAERDQLAADLRKVGESIAEREKQSTAAEQQIRTNFKQVLPSEQERSQRDRIVEEIGRLKAAASSADGRLKHQQEQDKTTATRQYVMDKVRDYLKDEAEKLNAAVLAELATLTQKMTRRIGAESISDMVCSPLGVVHLKKHGVRVGFSGIRNPGERVRVKLSFFLALALLGQQPLGARHPGILLIDQPGTAEMVPEDFKELAKILRGLDTDFGEHLQLICFTARSEFREATDPKKLFGPQAGKYAF
jgi:hypothetical protein